jgi:hypothetical protein
MTRAAPSCAEIISMSISFSPIGPWYAIVVAALVVMVLTVWAYERRLRGTSGLWRYLALGLRLAAVLLCLLAALRPSVVLQEKKKQAASLVFLLDGSTSMKINDEVRGQTRGGVALKTLKQARGVATALGPNLDVRSWLFDSTLHDQAPDRPTEFEGRETALGSALVEVLRRLAGKRIAALVVLSDGANNSGVPPLIAARRLRNQQVPVVTVGFGSENAGAGSKDIAVRDLVAGPTVFVKNQLLVRGVLVARGFANQPIEVEMYVEDDPKPVATQTVKVPEGTDVVPVTGLRYIPQTPGEKKITLRVKPKEGELLRANNEISTYITALAGGLNVLYLQGSTPTWEYKYLFRSIAASPDIQADLKVVRRPAGEESELSDDEFAPGRYNVYILGDLPADHLTRVQHRLLTTAVEKEGAGLIMLGGRSSFGAGGWASTELARILPVNIHPGDGQIEPEGGLKFVPSARGLDSYIFQVGPDKAETARIWDRLPPVTGTNRFGEPKPTASVLAEDPAHVPLMIELEAGKGRVLAFGGETWVWARASDEGRLAHRKFWRQVIFWLAHREDKGDNQVKLALDRRRIAVGQKLELTATARDSKNVPIMGVEYETIIERLDGSGAGQAAGAGGKPEPVPLFAQGDEAHGAWFATGGAGECKVTVIARSRGKEIGRDTARFLVYEDDRETENPAADLALLRQIAEATEGASMAPEQLPKFLRSLEGKMETEYVSQTEHRVWDNWPFLLIFTTLLMLEWWLRKRHGWV